MVTESLFVETANCPAGWNTSIYLLTCTFSHSLTYAESVKNILGVYHTPLFNQHIVELCIDNQNRAE